ncbi:MAG: DUF2271 domain-containing protein [Treponema sp.]|jgi:hypothetical protein|nr:DUF2271 domain-containing protein [Treponema sp.]
MKKLFLILLLISLVITNAAAQKAATAVELTFTFTRQGGSASNQFAAWIEDTEGKYIETLCVTRWTANGGYSRRPSSIPLWVKKSEPSKMEKKQIDAVSGATPNTGTLTYTWDGTDSKGAALPAGDYVLVLEGTLRWENQVYYRIPITIGKGSATPKVNVEYVGDATAERSMIKDVKVRVRR